MYEFQDLTPISGHFRNKFQNFRTTTAVYIDKLVNSDYKQVKF